MFADDFVGVFRELSDDEQELLPSPMNNVDQATMFFTLFPNTTTQKHNLMNTRAGHKV